MFYFVFNFSLSRGYSYYFWDNWVCIYIYIHGAIGKGMNQQIPFFFGSIGSICKYFWRRVAKSIYFGGTFEFFWEYIYTNNNF